MAVAIAPFATAHQQQQAALPAGPGREEQGHAALYQAQVRHLEEEVSELSARLVSMGGQVSRALLQQLLREPGGRRGRAEADGSVGRVVWVPAGLGHAHANDPQSPRNGGGAPTSSTTLASSAAPSPAPASAPSPSHAAALRRLQQYIMEEGGGGGAG